MNNVISYVSEKLETIFSNYFDLTKEADQSLFLTISFTDSTDQPKTITSGCS